MYECILLQDSAPVSDQNRPPQKDFLGPFSIFAQALPSDLESTDHYKNKELYLVYIIFNAVGRFY